MVLIEFNNDIAKFLCTECEGIIAISQNFLIDPKDFPKNRIEASGDGIHYICTCGSRYELIKSSNPIAKDLLKFKHVKVI
ncbi:MAG TPA: hypothetical protein DCP02_02640 [Actinobacteria bacterium]|nr:hypothetical protein [Actinomycetota bacterium]